MLLRTVRFTVIALAITLTTAGLAATPAQAGGRDHRGTAVRFATYNASLNRAAAGQLVSAT